MFRKPLDLHHAVSTTSFSALDSSSVDCDQTSNVFQCPATRVWYRYTLQRRAKPAQASNTTRRLPSKTLEPTFGQLDLGERQDEKKPPCVL